MNSNGKQGEHNNKRDRNLVLLERHQVGKPRTLAGIRDLIVVLDERDEAIPGHFSRGGSEVALPKRRITAVVHKTFGDGFLNVAQLAKPSEIRAIRAGQISANRMMKFVEPLRIDREAAFAVRVEDANITEIAFGNDPGLSSQVRGLFVKPVAKLGENVAGTEIENPVDSI